MFLIVSVCVIDIFSEGNTSDRGSILAADEASDRGGGGSVSDTGPPDRPAKPQPLTLDILPPPPPNNNSSSRRSDMVSTYIHTYILHSHWLN